MRYLPAVLFLCACIPAQGQFGPKHDAAWWKQQTDSYKLGYMTGYEAAHVTIQPTCVAEKVAMEICYRIAPTFPLGLDEKDALARLELFYEDRRNQDVSVELALVVVTEDIAAEAKHAYEHTQAVERMRQIAEPKPK